MQFLYSAAVAAPVIDITESLTSLADGVKGQINGAAPIILGVVVVMVSLKIGIKLFKSVANKIG